MSETSEGRSQHERLALIDTHCHLDDQAFDPDRGDVLAASRRAGVVGWVNVGFHPHRWSTTLQLSRSTSGMWHALGLHPQHAAEWSAETRRALRSLLQTSGAVAVGEIGLDYARGTLDRGAQRYAFAQQLEFGLELGLSVIIHQRAAEDDLIEHLLDVPSSHPVLLHSFDGDERLTALAKERGYMVGVGGLATRPRYKALRHRLKSLSLDQIVVESDAPYLVPHGVAGKRNTPANVAYVARFLACLQGVSTEDVATVTTGNAGRFFKQTLLADVSLPE